MDNNIDRSPLQDKLETVKKAYPLFGSHNSAFIQSSAQDIYQCCTHFSVKDWIHLNRIFEKRTSLEWYVDWRNIDPQEILNIISNEQAVYFLGIGTFHPNGYFRERCLRLLPQYGVNALPFVLLRTNDWVMKIRQIAEQYAKCLISQCSNEQIIEMLPFLYKVVCGKRRAKESIEILLEAAGNIIELPNWNALLQLDPKTRRLYYEILFEKGLVAKEQGIELLQKEPDSFTGKKVAERLLNTYNGDISLVQLLLQNKHFYIRFLTLQNLYETQQTDKIDLKEYLLDNSQLVREYTRFLLRNCKIDFTNFYENHLSEPVLFAAILGLSETGNKKHLPILKKYLQSKNPYILKAVLIALSRLDAEHEKETFYRYLLSEHTSVSKIAFKIIYKNKFRYGCQKYYEQILSGPKHLQKKFFTLIGFSSCWDSLPYLMMLYCSSMKEISEEAEKYLQIWHPNFMKPNNNEFFVLTVTYKKYKDSLPVWLIQKVDFVLKHI